MNTSVCRDFSRGGIYLPLALLILAVIGIGIFLMERSGSTADAEASDPQIAARQKAAEAAIQAGPEAADWPATPHGVIEAFWQAASEKDYARMMRLCPGSLESDFKSYYDQWTPSPVRSIGPPSQHPTQPHVQLIPVKIDFPGFAGKTIKMALNRLPDGRWAVDGQHTIWW